jgi:pSer/pThr/pTyr-binding forkhead associated (FHA) protein
MRIKTKSKVDYSKEELEKAELLEAYTKLLLGEKLSRKQKKLLRSHRYDYEEELAPLKKIVDFAHQQSEIMVESIAPSHSVSQRVENKLMDLISGNKVSAPSAREDLQLAYDIEPVGGDSELAQMVYEYDVVEELTPQEQQSKNCLLRFRVVEGDKSGREYLVTIPQIILGRGKDATINLEDSEVSREHAQLTVDNGDVYITDLDSSNGTYVDGQIIEKTTKLLLGSQIRLGNSLIVLSDVKLNPPENIIILKKLTDDVGKEYRVSMRDITIGRGPNAQIRLLDSSGKLSRIHAKLASYKDDLYIIDLDSSNGTYVDGKKITEIHQLYSGSIVKLGNIVIKILSIEH